MRDGWERIIAMRTAVDVRIGRARYAPHGCTKNGSDPTRPDQSMDTILQPLIETPLNALLLAPIAYFTFTIAFPSTSRTSTTKPPTDWRDGYSWRPASHPRTILWKKYTPKTLQPFNGKDDPRILLAIDRKVFDVTAGGSFYGPGMPVSLTRVSGLELLTLVFLRYDRWPIRKFRWSGRFPGYGQAVL